MSRIRIVAPLVATYWVVLLLGLTLFAATRQDAPEIVGPLWGGAIFGTLVGHTLGLLGLRLWFTILTAGLFVLLGYDGNVFWMAFAPATLFAALSVGDRWSLASFWFPAVIWMLTVLDNTNGKATPDGLAAVLLGVLAIAFIIFLRTRESRRVGLWQTVAAAPLAPSRSNVLKEHPGKEVGRTSWSLLVSAATFAFTAWLAPHLWELETFAGDPFKVAANDPNSRPGGGPPCCEDLVETERSRVKEYFDFGRSREKQAKKKQLECVPCDGGGGAGGDSDSYASRWRHLDPWESVDGNGAFRGRGGAGGGGGGGGTGGGGGGGGVGTGGHGTGHGSEGHGAGGVELQRDWDADRYPQDHRPRYAPPRPPRYTPPAVPPKPYYQPPRVEPVPPPRVKPEPTPEPKPEIAKVDPKPEITRPEFAPVLPDLKPPALPDPPIVAAPNTPKPQPPAAPQTSVKRPQQPNPRSSNAEILGWLSLLVASVLALQVARLAFRPLRRAVALRHLRKPFWEETVDQRVSNYWQLVLVGLRDAGWRTSGSEQPREFARRVGIDGVEECAAILDRTRHGIRIDAEDLEQMGRSAEAAYASARQGNSALARLGAQMRWPLA